MCGKWKTQTANGKRQKLQRVDDGKSALFFAAVFECEFGWRKLKSRFAELGFNWRFLQTAFSASCELQKRLVMFFALCIFAPRFYRCFVANCSCSELSKTCRKKAIESRVAHLLLLWLLSGSATCNQQCKPFGDYWFCRLCAQMAPTKLGAELSKAASFRFGEHLFCESLLTIATSSEFRAIKSRAFSLRSFIAAFINGKQFFSLHSSLRLCLGEVCESLFRVCVNNESKPKNNEALFARQFAIRFFFFLRVFLCLLQPFDISHCNNRRKPKHKASQNKSLNQAS